jgi:NUMOD3 motif
MTDDQTNARWRGRRYSLETRAKMSEAAKRRVRAPHSPETRAKISMATRGKRGPHSAEHCAKISASNRGRRFTAEHIAKLTAAKRGRALPAEHCAKIATAVRERWARMRTEEGRATDDQT